MSIEPKGLVRSTILAMVLTSLISTASWAQSTQRIRGAVGLPGSAQSVASAGTFDGKLYTNEPLGFSMLVPGGWTIFAPDENAAAFASGRANTLSNTAGLSETERRQVDRSIANTQILFQAVSRQTEPPTPLSRLSCGIEKLTSATSRQDYVETNKKLVLMTSPTKVARDVYSTTVGELPFAGFDVEGTASGKTFRQRYLVTIRRGFALFLVITLWDDINNRVLDASLRTLRFKSPN